MNPCGLMDRRVASAEAGRPVRVLHVNAGNQYGGVETLLTTLASLRHLCPSLEPHFAVCYEDRSSRELVAAGVPVHLLGAARISRPWTVWRARRKLRELLLEERFDLVICHMAWSLALFSGVARQLHQRVALWAHGFPARENWLERMAQWTRPDLAIANSCFTAASVRGRFEGGPTEVIYCPVALVDLPDVQLRRATLRQEYGVSDDTAVILQVGRLEPWKGHLIHLQALSLLKTGAKWVCWIAGGPQTGDQEEYFRRVEEFARQVGLAGRVRFLGQRSDVASLLAAADVFCQPNQGPEPFGLVFIEALWASLPVVTSRLGGALEIIDNSCGLLVQPGDAEGLASVLTRLIESPELRRQLGNAGPARARQLCDPAEQLEKLRKVSQGTWEDQGRRSADRPSA